MSGKSAPMRTSTGMVALLFTDLVGSTEMLERLGEDAADELRRTHFSILRRAVAEGGGREVKSLGDGLMVSFPSSVQAVGCAVTIQRAIAEHNRNQPDRMLVVRVGLHLGEPMADEDDLFGTSVVVAKRLCDQAEGGQILASELVATMVGSRGGFRFVPAGRLALKGLAEPLPAVAVEWEAEGPPTTLSPPPAVRPPSTVRAPRGPRLVGRQRDLTLLENELRRAATGEFCCVLLTGEPGVGKTRLANELVIRHRDEVVSLLARAYPLGGTASFGLWSESLDRHLRAVTPQDILRLCGGFTDDLAGLLRSVAAVRGSVPEGDLPRHRLLEGLAVVFSNLAAESPVVVVLDDVHLADASSWEALQYLASNLPESRLLVVAAARPVELAEHEIASRILFGLEQEGFLTRLDLRPLDTDALSELTQAVVGQAPPPTLVAWLDERCRGNPLFTIGLLRALEEEGANLTSPRLRRLPEALAERVEERLRRLDDPARSTLEVLAVLGRRVELRELAGMSSLPTGQLASVLESVVRNGLLSEEERGVELTYEMSHPLIQEAVYQAIGTARRRVLHRLVARALLAAGRPGEAAPHFARSAEVGDSEAVDALRHALGEAERRGAYREALSVLGSLVDLLPQGDKRWLEIADAISWEAEWVIDHRADRYAEMAIGALRAIDTALGPDAEPALRAGLQFRLASFLGWGTGDVEAAQLAARDAVSLFEAAGDRQRALLAELEHGLLLMMGGDTQAALAAGWQVVARAEPAGDEFVLMQAFGRSIGLPALMLGRLAESEDALQHASVLAEAAGRTYFNTMVEMFLSLNGAVRGRLDEAFRYMAKAKSNPEWRETLLLESQCLVHWIAGDLGTALAAADESLTWNAGRLGRRRAWGLAYAVVSAVEAERLDDARRYLSPVLGSYGGRRWAGFSAVGEWAAAMMSWQERGPAAALDALRAAASAVLEVEFLALGAPILADLAEAAAACDRADVARETADRLGEIAAQVDSDLDRGLAALASAYAELVTGGAKPRAAAARRAAETFAHTGCRLFSGRALDVLGRALTDSDRAGAVQAFEESASLFGGCGATWRRSRTIDALAQLGSRGRRAAGAVLGPASLTGRERQVARLAAQGLTVRQIGERLFIGERTVESHLARAYAKLGVSSKADLVARASGLGL